VRLLPTLAAFLKRDFLIEISYRTSFVMQAFGIFFSSLIWYFVARLVDAPRTTPGLAGVDYFAYVLTGIALLHYLTSAMLSFAGKIRSEQMSGTLEAMLVTPTPIGTIVLGSSLWDFLLTSVKVLAYLLVGTLIFGVVLHLGNLLPALVIIGLTILAFSGIGILGAAFVLYLKRGDPITYLVSSGSALFGSVFYPAEDMPAWMETLSRFLPITYALRALRASLLRGEPLAALLPDLQILLAFIAVLLPTGILAFRFAVRKARQEGSLVQY
jgi:ABC-2 type transport system permease protein